jgi:hypothetical protein
LSGLNFITILSLADPTFAQYFRVTEEELSEFAKTGEFDQILEWYSGYIFGVVSMVNPYSLIQYLYRGTFSEHWTGA